MALWSNRGSQEPVCGFGSFTLPPFLQPVTHLSEAWGHLADICITVTDVDLRPLAVFELYRIAFLLTKGKIELLYCDFGSLLPLMLVGDTKIVPQHIIEVYFQNIMMAPMVLLCF